MRKIFLLCIFISASSFCFSQDACYNTYMDALQDYGKGNYIEAQRKFVLVAQTCGDYSDVWNKLKNCNKKLAEKQSQQVSSLSNEKQQLEAELKKSEAENNKKLADAIGQTQYYKEQCKLKADSIQMQLKWNLVWRDSVGNLNQRLDSITRLLDSANSQIKKGKQQNMPNKADSGKDGSSKEISGKSKGLGRNHPHPSKQTEALVPDTLISDTTTLK